LLAGKISERRFKNVSAREKYALTEEERTDTIVPDDCLILSPAEKNGIKAV